MVDTLTTQLAERYAARKAAASSPAERLFAFIDAHVALGRDADPRGGVA